MIPNSLRQLVTSLKQLPGIGPKSAQRMAFHLLERNRNGAADIAIAISNALENVKHCEQCRAYCESNICHICADSQRDSNTVCVVESPANVAAIEESNVYRGLYFVLMGNLSPLDGIGPSDIGLLDFFDYVQRTGVKEVILANGTTVEGEATAHYIFEKCQALDVKVSRIAQGIPLGGELDYIDAGTLAHSLAGRTTYT
jgi:recombination protein RecR